MAYFLILPAYLLLLLALGVAALVARMTPLGRRLIQSGGDGKVTVLKNRRTRGHRIEDFWN
jgi:ribose/xylose/arabinose/galactoside ABC-type transport system permease subunit